MGLSSVVLPPLQQFSRRAPADIVVVRTPMASAVADGNPATLAVAPITSDNLSQIHSPPYISLFPLHLSRLHEVYISLRNVDDSPVQFLRRSNPFFLSLVFVADLI